MTDDYIRREDAVDAFNRAVQDVGILDADDIETVFGMLSSADVAPVVHGKWISECEPHYECSKCHHWFHLYQYMNYCPNCGAKMDGGENG